MTDLLPCPFCGGEAHVERIGNSGYFFVACSTPGCCDSGLFDTEAEAIAAWNTRAEHESYSEVCSDDRFELIAKAKAKLLDATNIESRPDEVAVLDSILFRCWQMGWLDQLRDAAYCTLTAEQVRGAIFNGSTYASYDGAKYYADGINMQVIADELNAHYHCGLTDEDYNGGE